MEAIFENSNRTVLAEIDIFGFKYELSNPALVLTLVSVVLVIIAYFIKKNLKEDGVPSKFQCLIEWFVEIVNNLCRGNIGHHGMDFAPYIGTVLLLLGAANIAGVFAIQPFIHTYPPARDINIAGAMAVCSLLVILYSGFRYKGFIGWLKSLCDPMPIVFPLKLMEYASKPMSLCLRLFGNVFAAWFIMELIYHFIPFFGAPVSIYFDLFDGILQAFIFTYLTSIYIGEAVE